MKFKLETDIHFEANDLDDACQKLTEHFLAVKTCERLGQRLNFVGNFRMKPNPAEYEYSDTRTSYED